MTATIEETIAQGEEFATELFHYGTKGMKWGVRKAEQKQQRADRAKQAFDASRAKRGKAPKPLNTKRIRVTASKAEARAIRAQREADRFKKKSDKKLRKADEKWEKSIYTTKGAVAVHNKTAEHFNKHIDALNDKHPDAHLDFPDKPETKAYMDDIMALESKGYALAVTAVHGSSPSGKKKAVYVEDEAGARIEVRSTDVKHAEEVEPDLVFLLKVEDGHILELNEAEGGSAEHSDDSEAFLAHYGVKGMKWGVTNVDRASEPTVLKESTSKKGPKEITVTQRKEGVYVKSKGGQRHGATIEAVKAEAARQKVKKSTVDALTNQELKDATERMRLENNFRAELKKNQRISFGKALVDLILGEPEAQKGNGSPKKKQS